MGSDIGRRIAAEFFGTFWLVFGGCGAAVLAAGFPNLGIGFVGVAFAFGLTVLTMAYAVGHISGGHFNPAVTIGLWTAGRCASGHVIPYVIAQVLAAIAAAEVLWVIASSHAGWIPGGFASNGYGDLSPGKYGLGGCFMMEVVMTFFFLFIIIGTTSKGAAVGFAGIPIGLALTLIHLVSIPVTNTSVNPARSTGPALFAGGEYIGQLWLFWVAPIAGAVIALATRAGLRRRLTHRASPQAGRCATYSLLLAEFFRPQAPIWNTRVCSRVRTGRTVALTLARRLPFSGPRLAC
jgi:aquaporin Z